MAVGADDGITGMHKSLLEQNLVAYAGVDVEEVLDPELLDELAYDLMVLGVFLIRRRYAMVEYYNVAVRVVDFIDPQ